MIIEAGNASRLSLVEDNRHAEYAGTSVLYSTQPAGAAATESSVRLTLEIRRSLGGMVMRALIGGVFTPASDDLVRFEVRIAGTDFDSGVAPTCDSELGRPLVPGLPEDFASSTLAGLVADRAGAALPAGVLVIDRAGYDVMGSSESAFYQAGLLLRAAIATTLAGDDVAARLALKLAEIPADAHAVSG